MKISIRQLRKMIQEVISESPGVTADPTEVKGFYFYDLERGSDIHGYWYKSPGDKGSSDPGRPEDAEEYIGLKPKASNTETETTSTTQTENYKKKFYTPKN